MILLTTLPPGAGHPTGISMEALLTVTISICTGLLLLVGYFINRTLTGLESSIQANNTQTAALRTELATVKADLKDYAGQVQRQSEELSTLKRAYAALERAFSAMDKWLYGQAVLGHLPQPPDFRAKAASAE